MCFCPSILTLSSKRSYISYKKEKFLVKHQVIEYYKNLHDNYGELWTKKRIFKNNINTIGKDINTNIK